MISKKEIEDTINVLKNSVSEWNCASSDEYPNFTDELGHACNSAISILQEQLKQDRNCYNSVNIGIGDKRFCVINDYPKYIVREGTCKKISKHNENLTKYTFKMNNYKTYTFTETSFGKKVFEDKESAERVVNKLNEKCK
jgi:hypothetical protein